MNSYRQQKNLELNEFKGLCTTLDYSRFEYGVPTGIRTPVTAVKGRCPRPLDDRDVEDGGILRSRHQTVKEVR